MKAPFETCEVLRFSVFSKSFSQYDYGGGTVIAKYSASRSPDFSATDDNRCVIVYMGNKTYNTIVVDGTNTPAAPVQPAANDGTWIRPTCRAAGNTDKFCPECGTKMPER